MRCQLDDIIAASLEALDILRAVETRMVQRARTAPEADDVVELLKVQRALQRIQRAARAEHPNRRED